MFLYNIGAMTTTDISISKAAGTNDLDPKFSPNEAEVIYVNTSNDGVSQQNVTKLSLATLSEITILIENAKMPDWK